MLTRAPDRVSNEALAREGNSLKKTARFLSTPGLISLGGGLPSSEYFPFDALDVTVPAPAPAPGRFGAPAALATTLHIGKHDLARDRSLFDIATAFNYGQGAGAAQLLRWVTEHTETVHDPPYADWACVLSAGSTSALDMALRMLARPGDVVLAEDYTFATAVDTAAPLGVRFAGVPMDDQGLLPSAMDAMLDAWDPVALGAAKPALLYTLPTGQNPTGVTPGAQRRRDIYRVAQKHDLLVIEDDPYYLIAPFAAAPSPDAPDADATHAASDDHDSANDDDDDTATAAFLASLLPSLLSLDTDGRVLRLDTFSKVVAPGARLGWITAPAPVAAMFQRHADVSTQGPAGMAQLLVWKLVDDEGWGHAGFFAWLRWLRAQYAARRDAMARACRRHLPADVVRFVPPNAGMFVRRPLVWSAAAAAAALLTRCFPLSLATAMAAHPAAAGPRAPVGAGARGPAVPRVHRPRRARHVRLVVPRRPRRRLCLSCALCAVAASAIQQRGRHHWLRRCRRPRRGLLPRHLRRRRRRPDRRGHAPRRRCPARGAALPARLSGPRARAGGPLPGGVPASRWAAAGLEGAEGVVRRRGMAKLCDRLQRARVRPGAGPRSDVASHCIRRRGPGAHRSAPAGAVRFAASR